MGIWPAETITILGRVCGLLHRVEDVLAQLWLAALLIGPVHRPLGAVVRGEHGVPEQIVGARTIEDALQIGVAEVAEGQGVQRLLPVAQGDLERQAGVVSLLGAVVFERSVDEGAKDVLVILAVERGEEFAGDDEGVLGQIGVRRFGEQLVVPDDADAVPGADVPLRLDLLNPPFGP